MRVRARVRRRQPEGLDRVRIRVRVKGPRTAPPTRRLESAGGDLWVKRGVSTVVYPATLQPYLRCNPIYAATLSTLQPYLPCSRACSQISAPAVRMLSDVPKPPKG